MLFTKWQLNILKIATMKKTYIAPNIKVRLVKKCNIISTSDFGVDPTKPTSQQLGRGGWLDDDDWDE